MQWRSFRFGLGVGLGFGTALLLRKVLLGDYEARLLVPSDQPWNKPVERPARASRGSKPATTTATTLRLPRPADDTDHMASNTNGHSERPWVAPEDGVCPGDYPVKAKLGSRVYRVPGAKGYEDSKPERCYSSVEAVEADGFNEAKR